MLIDSFGRKIDYLRISVTDRCNLRCVYCMPAGGIINKPHAELLTFEEIGEIVSVCAKLGIEKIRFTGGEPLVRKNLADLISSLSKISGIKDIALTTNGMLLKEQAGQLKKAGLKRVNISLDSLRHDRYRNITRQGDLEKVWEGIREASNVGFFPVKVNVLLLEDIDQYEIANFLSLTLEDSFHIRFLEFMPVNSFYKAEGAISGEGIMKIARGFGDIEEAKMVGNGPARVYKFKNGRGTFGIISPMSCKFCFRCNRLRLTSDGFLKACLHSELKVNLRDPLRGGANADEISKLIKAAVDMKPREHSLDREGTKAGEFSMCQIGG